jgi:hypothetical protein
LESLRVLRVSIKTIRNLLSKSMPSIDFFHD